MRDGQTFFAKIRITHATEGWSRKRTCFPACKKERKTGKARNKKRPAVVEAAGLGSGEAFRNNPDGLVQR